VSCRTALLFCLIVVLPGVAMRAAPHLSWLMTAQPATSDESTGRPDTPAASQELRRRSPRSLALGLAAEGLLVGTMLYLVVRSGLLAATFFVLKPGYRFIVVALIALQVIGLIGGSVRNTYPFIPWRMHVRVPAMDPVVLGYQGRREDETLAVLGVQPYLPIAITTAVLLTIRQGLCGGFGYVCHQKIPILLSVYNLAVFPSVDGFTWRQRRTVPVAAPIYAAVSRGVAGIRPSVSPVFSFCHAHFFPRGRDSDVGRAAGH